MKFTSSSMLNSGKVLGALAMLVIPASGAFAGTLVITTGGTSGNTTFTLDANPSTSSNATTAAHSATIGGSYTNQVTAVVDTTGTLATTAGGTIAGTQWIGPVLPPTASDSNFWLYTTTFTAPVGGTTFNISGILNSDNLVQAAYLNYGQASQQALTLTTSGGNGNTYTLNDTFTGGPFNGPGNIQTLSFIINNSNGQPRLSGLDYKATITAVPEPGVVVTSLSMAGMTGLGLIRGRRRGKAAKAA